MYKTIKTKFSFRYKANIHTETRHNNPITNNKLFNRTNLFTFTMKI